MKAGINPGRAELINPFRFPTKANWQSLYRNRPKWTRPPAWVFDQYPPRPVIIDKSYALVQTPPHPPVIAIVTPTLNQARFLAATIDSVLSQNYPNLSYHVQDGGSTDETTEVLASYGTRLSWRTERDSGQANAINRAFARNDCEIMAYLNGDDVLLPGTLAYVARFFAERPNIDLVYGNRIFIDSSGNEIGRAVLPQHDDKALSWGAYVPQETLFWRHRVMAAIGPFDETFDYALDWDFMLRASAAGFKFFHVPRFLACFRVHPGQKTQKNRDLGLREVQRLRQQYLGHIPTRSEVALGLLPYLLRQFMVHWMYKCGISRL